MASSSSTRTVSSPKSKPIVNRLYHRPLCNCGVEAPLVMAWTRDNAGRRFFGCRHYGGVGFCGFRVWHDEPTPERLKAIIYGLVKKLDSGGADGTVRKEEAVQMRGVGAGCSNDAEVRKLRSESRKLRVIVVLSWLFFWWFCNGWRSESE